MGLFILQHRSFYKKYLIGKIEQTNINKNLNSNQNTGQSIGTSQLPKSWLIQTVFDQTHQKETTQ